MSSKKNMTDQQFDLQMSKINAKQWKGNMRKTVQLHLNMPSMIHLEKVLRKEETRLKATLELAMMLKIDAKRTSDSNLARTLGYTQRLSIELARAKSLKRWLQSSLVKLSQSDPASALPAPKTGLQKVPQPSRGKSSKN